MKPRAFRRIPFLTHVIRGTLLTHPVLSRATVSRVPVVLRAIDASLQAVESHLPGCLVVGHACGVQVDGDRLPQPVSVQHEQVSQVAA